MARIECALPHSPAHEQCQVDLDHRARGASGDDQERARSSGVPVRLVDASVFDALEDGAALDGPTPRGLYRFWLNIASDGAAEIDQVEEDALLGF